MLPCRCRANCLAIGGQTAPPDGQSEGTGRGQPRQFPHSLGHYLTRSIYRIFQQEGDSAGVYCMDAGLEFSILILLLVVCAAGDVKRRMISDACTLLFIFPGLMYAFQRTPMDMLTGIILAAGILWFTYACARICPGRFGWGDGKLLAVLALCVPALMWYCSLLGCTGVFIIHASVQYAGQVRRNKADGFREFAAPLGPYLLAGFLILPLWSGNLPVIYGIVFRNIV